MTYHILNGDALNDKFPDISGEKIIFRECMIDGPIYAKNLQTFLSKRALFIADYFNTTIEGYHKKCTNEIFKLEKIQEDEEVILWFEDDLFCQTNLWFCANFLFNQKIQNISLVSPNHSDWIGFGNMTKGDLKLVYDDKTVLHYKDMESFSSLWIAYQQENNKKMQEIASNLSHIITRLPKVVQAHLDRKRESKEIGRPEKVLLNLKKQGIIDFRKVFSAFSKSEGIYGFGDLQIKNMWEQIGNK